MDTLADLRELLHTGRVEQRTESPERCGFAPIKLLFSMRTACLNPCLNWSGTMNIFYIIGVVVVIIVVAGFLGVHV
jgi:hypothetical protein